MNNAAVVPFYFQGNEIRSISDERNNPWFVAKDVCDALGLEHITNALSKVPDHHLTVIRLQSGDQMREMKIVDEPGLYRLVLRSDKPQAEPFMEWVTEEALPAIRKTGSYSVVGGTSAIDTFVKQLMGVINPLVGLTNEMSQRILLLENRTYRRSHQDRTIFSSELVDQVRRFVDEACVVKGTAQVRKVDLHNAYVRWCTDRGALVEKYGTFFRILYRAELPIRPSKVRLGNDNSSRGDCYVIRGLALRTA